MRNIRLLAFVENGKTGGEARNALLSLRLASVCVTFMRLGWNGTRDFENKQRPSTTTGTTTGSGME